MGRFRALVAVILCLPLVASEISWVLALVAMADGSHHVALHSPHGHTRLVLHHPHPAVPDRGDDHLVKIAGFHGRDNVSVVGVARDSHRHGDHVVDLPGSPRMFTTATRLSQSGWGSPIVLQADIGPSCVHSQLSSRCLA